MSDVMTARFVESVKPRHVRRAYADGLVPGLELRVAPTGLKAWALRYRVHKRTLADGTKEWVLRRMTLGTYPPLTLADARSQAMAAMRRVESGEDPAIAKVERREADTMAELVRRYVEEYAEPRKRSWKDDRRILHREVLPLWRHHLAVDIRRRDVRDLVDAVARRGAPIGANRVRAILHKLFNFALSVEIVESNPVAGVPKPGVERQRDRVLTSDEIRQFWNALDGEPPAMAAFYRLRLVTAQRGGEVLNMRWSDVDLADGWWVIPAAGSKNRLPHRVPLGPRAMELLAGLLMTARKEAVFVLEGARGKRQQSQVAGRLGLPDFRGHDLRRTSASSMASAGVLRLVIGKVLNHVERGVTAIYDRHGYDAEKRQALEVWDQRLTEILNEERSGALLPFTRAGR